MDILTKEKDKSKVVNLKYISSVDFKSTVCPGSIDPPEKIFNIFASEMRFTPFINYIRYFRVNIISL